MLSRLLANLKQDREYILSRREQLVAQAKDFEAAIERNVAEWKAGNDPVTDRPWLLVENIDGVPWGRRLRLFNRHFVEFVITRDGLLTMRTSASHVHMFDAGFGIEAHGTGQNVTLCEYVDGGVMGTPVARILDEAFQELIKLGDLVEYELVR